MNDNAFMNRVLHGERPTHDETLDYYVAFHRARPRATPNPFGKLRDANGRTSYELLADRVPKLETQAILDVGCGDGTLLGIVAKRLAEVTSYHGIDIAEKELERARAAFPQASFLEANINALPFADASFDVVLSHLVLMLLPNAESAFHEIRRVLRPEGHLLAVIVAGEHQNDRLFSLYRFIHERIRMHYPAYAPINPGDERMRSMGGVQQLLANAGFGSCSLERFIVEASFDPADVWSFLEKRYYFGSLPHGLEESVRADVVDWLDSEALRVSETLVLVHAESLRPGKG